MIERLETIEKRYEEITKELSTTEVLNNISLLTKLSKEQSSLKETVDKYKRYKRVLEDIEGAKELLKDPELKEMAQ